MKGFIIYYYFWPSYKWLNNDSYRVHPFLLINRFVDFPSIQSYFFYQDVIVKYINILNVGFADNIQLSVVVYRQPVCAVWPNHEVVDLQPRSVTTPNVGSVNFCSVSIITVPPFLPYFRYTSLWGRVCLLPCPLTPPVAPPHGIICPPGHPPSPPQTTNTASSLHRFLRSPEHLPYHMPIPRLLPSLDVFRSLLIPPTATPAGFLLPPLPCVCQNLF